MAQSLSPWQVENCAPVPVALHTKKPSLVVCVALMSSTAVEQSVPVAQSVPPGVQLGRQTPYFDV